MPRLGWAKPRPLGLLPQAQPWLWECLLEQYIAIFLDASGWGGSNEFESSRTIAVALV
jgi:hypothetical protein